MEKRRRPNCRNASLFILGKIPALLICFLERISDNMAKLITAVSIFEINSDSDMIEVALLAFKNMDNSSDSYYVYKLGPAFYHLARLKNQEVNELIQTYCSHTELLIAHNAKQALANPNGI